MDAAGRYREMVRATFRQRARLLTAADLDARWDAAAPAYRFDPRRALGPNLEVLAALIEPTDTLIEVGGGAGRVALPLALRCAHVTNVEPSKGMVREFQASAAAAGIENVAVVPERWPASEPVVADVVMCEDMTYFVEEIVP